MIAGSNPNVDVNLTTAFPTTYKVEYFYPPYYSANRPVPTGIPQTLTYGGKYFDITVPSSSYSGSANTAADKTKIMVIRPGWTTHAMSMGQRALQLNNTYHCQQRRFDRVPRFPDASQRQHLPTWTRVRLRDHQRHS
jgi:hypothetical protein